MVLQFIPRPPSSIWRAGDGIWKVGGGIWREEQISDNLDSKPENYLWVFEVGRSIKHENICKVKILKIPTITRIKYFTWFMIAKFTKLQISKYNGIL